MSCDSHVTIMCLQVTELQEKYTECSAMLKEAKVNRPLSLMHTLIHPFRCAGGDSSPEGRLHDEVRELSGVYQV